MTILLIDIGNTRIKWASLDKNGFHFLGQDCFSDACLRKIITKKYASIWVANVAGAQLEAHLRTLLSDDQTVYFPVSERKSVSGVVNAYIAPEKLGVDRWLAIQATWQEVKAACCVIDCGTAITLDRIDANGQHMGGLIFPGLRMMRKALHRGTDALPEVMDSKTPAAMLLANNTVHAIMKGTLLGVSSFIELQVLPNEVVFLTGGDAQLIAPTLLHEVTVDAQLVLKGLAINALSLKV